MRAFFAPKKGEKKVINKESKRQIEYEVINILGILALFCVVTRIWPLLFLVIPAVLIAALRLLFLSAKKPMENTAVENPPKPAIPENEGDVVRIAFGILQRRIAEDVTARYPSARIVWGVPNPIENFAQGLPLTIILNRAGGFSKVAVLVYNLQFKGLTYETVTLEHADESDDPEHTDKSDDPEQPDESPDDSDDSGTLDDTPPVDSEPVDYSVLAYEWVDANKQRLNETYNEELTGKSYAMLIPAESLPVSDSWEFICQQLISAGFPNAVIDEDGIQIFLRQCLKTPSERE